MENKASTYYYPQLDSIRGLSVLAIFFFHAYHPVLDPGLLSQFLSYVFSILQLSIEVFFVLSAFLLTWLGMSEYEKKGNFSLQNYFKRRVLRIWPLYYLILLFAFVALPFLAGKFGASVTLPPAYYYLFFISNFYYVNHVYFLRFLWSLSVEEQFYLVWGFCLLFLQKHLKVVIALFILVSIGFSFYAITNGVSSYFNTLTYLFDFAMGALAAILIKNESNIVLFFQNISIKRSVVFYSFLPVLFAIGFLSSKYSQGSLKDTIALLVRLIFIIYIALVIIEQMVNKNTLLKLSNSKWLIYTGKISYGLYCFHGIILTFGVLLLTKIHFSLHPLIQAFLFLALTYLIAALSYQLIEKPFLLLKNKFRRV